MEPIVLSEKELKDVQVIEKEMLVQLIDICQKYNLKYYIAYGSLIGVVRHNGFIPWDDDIDVLMPRKDYDVFINIAQKELPQHMFVQNEITDPEYLGGFTKIRNSNTTFIEINNMKKRMNHGIYIDVFPLDNCPSSRLGQFLFDLRKRLFFLRLRCEFVIVEGEIRHKKSLSGLIQLASKILKIFSSNIERLFANTEQYLRGIKYTGCVCNFYACIKKDKYKSEWFQEGTIMAFEGIEVIVPKEYDSFLTYQYGDYMKLPKIEDRVSRHFTMAIDCKKPYIEYLNF